MFGFKLLDIVKISSANEWNGLVGIVEKVENNKLFIFCVAYPTKWYVIHEGNSNEISLFKDVPRG